MLGALGDAVDALALALACLGGAYEQLDEHSADRLEAQLFRPVQMAYGRAKRTYDAFAARHGLEARAFEQRPPGGFSQRAAVLIERAVEAAAAADRAIAELQDSMLPVEVGDPELRAGLSEVRVLIADLRARARELVRTLGR